MFPSTTVFRLRVKAAGLYSPAHVGRVRRSARRARANRGPGHALADADMADLFVTDHTPTLGVGRALRSDATTGLGSPLPPRSTRVLYVRFGAFELAFDSSRPNIRLHAVDSSRGLRRAAAVAGSRLAGAP